MSFNYFTKYKLEIIAAFMVLIPFNGISQSVWKSSYNNTGSYTIDLSYSRYSGTPFSIYSLSGEWRLLYFNLGCDLSVGTEETQDPYPAFINGHIGISIPLYHQKFASTTFNINAVTFNFEEGQTQQLSGWGWEVYGRYNTSFGNLKFGYSKAPDVDLRFFDLNGFFVRAGIGFNKFKRYNSKGKFEDKKYSFSNTLTTKMEKSTSKKELRELLLDKVPHLKSK